MRQTEAIEQQSERQATDVRNTPGYVFVDRDILIVLNALEQRDRDDLDSDVVITMPVSLADGTLASKLKEISQFSPNQKTYIPYNIPNPAHWQLIRISKDDEQIVCGLYDTDGKVIRPDDDLLGAIHAEIPAVEFVDPETCDWHQWDLPAQKGVNCGMVVALMAHQLRLKSTVAQASKTRDYADFDPTVKDEFLRNQVSSTVIEHGNDIDKMVFCTYNPSDQHQLSRISYNSENPDQKSIYAACEKLSHEQMDNIARIILKHAQDPTREPLRAALSKLSYAGFLFKKNDENETCWRDEAENTCLYYCAMHNKKSTVAPSEQDPMHIEGAAEQRHHKLDDAAIMADQQLYDATGGVAYHITHQDTSDHAANPSIISNMDLGDRNARLLTHYSQYRPNTRVKIREKLQRMLSGDHPYLFSHQADAAVHAWVALSQGKPFLLGDQPGVGKTRTMLATIMLYQASQTQPEKKALIIVSNDAQVNIFKSDIKAYMGHQDDMAVDIKKISEVQKMRDFSAYDLMMVDEVHSMIDSKSIKSTTDGKLNHLLEIVQGKKVLLASATAAKSIEELTSIMPILDNSGSKVTEKSQKNSNTHAMIKSALFVEHLVDNGQIISRMLSGSKKLGDDIKAERISVCHIQNTEEHTSLTTELHVIYDKIVNKIAALRTLCAQRQGKDSYDADNGLLLAYIQRCREEVIKCQFISEAVQKRQDDPGYHTMICVREYGSQESRMQAILAGFKTSVCEGSEQATAVDELNAHMQEFQEKCENFSKENGAVFNPDSIVPEERNAIVVCSRSHLTGVNLNDMLSARGKPYRDGLKSAFKFQLSVVESLESWTTVWQGIHRVMRCNNQIHYGEGLSVKQVNFASRLSRIVRKRETQKIITDHLRLGSHESSHQSDLINACKIKLTASMDESLRNISALSQEKFLIEIDFLPIGQLQEVARIVDGALNEIKEAYATKHHLDGFELIHQNQNNQSMVAKKDNLILCSKSAILRYNDYFSVLFDCEPKQFTVQDRDEIFFGWDVSGLHHSDLAILYDKAIYQYIDSQLIGSQRDRFIDQLTAEYKKSKKSRERDKSGPEKKHKSHDNKPGTPNGTLTAKIHPLFDVMGGPTNGRKNSVPTNALKHGMFGIGTSGQPLTCQLSSSDTLESTRGTKHSRSADTPGHGENSDTQRDSKKSKRDQSKTHTLSYILDIGPIQSKAEMPKSRDSNGSSDDKKSAQKHPEKRSKKTHTSLQSIVNESTEEQYQEKIIAALEEHGYQILLEWLTMEDYKYSIYHHCLRLGDWAFILECENHRQPNQKSCLGMRSIGKICEEGYNGWSTLHHAVFHKNIEAVKYLCHNGSLELLHCRTQDEDDQSTALHIAMANYAESSKNQEEGMASGDLKGEVEMINVLLSCQIPGCDFNIKDHNGQYPTELLSEEQFSMLLGSGLSETAHQRLESQKAHVTLANLMGPDGLEMATDHSDDMNSIGNDGASKKRSYSEVESHDQSSGTQISRMLTKMIDDKKKLDKEVQQLIEAYDSNQPPSIALFDKLILALQIPDTEIDFRKKVLDQLTYHCQSIQVSRGYEVFTNSHNQHIEDSLRKLMKSDLLSSSERAKLLDNCYCETIEDVQVLKEVFQMSRPQLQKMVLHTIDKYLESQQYYHEQEQLSPNTQYKNHDFAATDSLVHLLILHRRLDLLQILHYAGFDIRVPNSNQDTVWHSLLAQTHCGEIDPLLDGQSLHMWIETLPNITEYIREKNANGDTILNLWVQHSDDGIFSEFGAILIKNHAIKSGHLIIPCTVLENALERCKNKNLVIEGLQDLYDASQQMMGRISPTAKDLLSAEIEPMIFSIDFDTNALLFGKMEPGLTYETNLFDNVEPGLIPWHKSGKAP